MAKNNKKRKRSSNKRTSPRYTPSTWKGVVYHLSRDIFGGIGKLIFKLANKSQLLPAGILGFMLIAAMRMPGEDLGETVKSLTKPAWFHPFGWVLAGIAIVIAIYLLHNQRSTFTKEIERLSKERDRLQRELGISPESSQV